MARARGRPRAPRPADGRGGGVRDDASELPLAVVDAAPVIPARRRRGGRCGDAVVTVAHLRRSRSPSRSRCARCSSPRPAGRGSKVFTALLDGSMRSPGAWGLTLTTAAPLLIVAVGTIVATKAGLVEHRPGGPAAASALVLRLRGRPHPRPRAGSRSLAALAAGVVGGALWAGLAAGMRFWRKVPEVISTLLLVFVAFQLVAYGLTKTLAAARPHASHQQEQHRRAAADRPHVRSPAPLRQRPQPLGRPRPRAGRPASRCGCHGRSAASGSGCSGSTRGRRSGPASPRSKVGGTALVASGAFAGLAGGVLLTSGVRGRPDHDGVLRQLRLAGPPGRPAGPGPPAGRHPDGVRLRRAAHGQRLPGRHRRRAADRRRRPGHARPRPPHPAGHRGDP